MIERSDFSLKEYNTFGIDAKAKCFIEYQNTDELVSLIRSSKLQQPYLHVGRGSNLLFTHDFEGLVLHSGIQGVECTEVTGSTSVRLRVGAGVIWDDFVAYCVDHLYYGAENLSLIAGEVGASAVQNIGAYGSEAAQIIESVETIDADDGSLKIFNREDCAYGYRQSIFKQPSMKHYFVTHVNFVLTTSPTFDITYGSLQKEIDTIGELTLKNVRQAVIAIRRAKLPDPKDIGNAGSFFINPIVSHEVFDALQKQYPTVPFYELSSNQIKVPAGWLIEQSGWKGKSLGPAGVYPKQALVLVNLGGAKGSDIVKLSNQICSDVEKKFDIQIHPEVNFI